MIGFAPHRIGNSHARVQSKGAQLLDQLPAILAMGGGLQNERHDVRVMLARLRVLRP